MAEIEVEPAGSDQFLVRVREGGGETEHWVYATAGDMERYGGDVSPERLIEESFRFLLERESKESILPRFELPVIETYFPEYPAEIRRRLTRS